MRPLILALDVERKRSPLLTQFYNYMTGLDCIKFKLDNRLDTPVQKTIETRCSRLPDYLYWGFSEGSAFKKSEDYILKNNFKIIHSVSDVEQFTTDYKPKNQNFYNIGIDYLILRWPELENYSSLLKIEKFIKEKDWLSNAKIIYIPWGVDPDVYVNRGLERDIDVSLVCTMADWGIYEDFHSKRKQARDALQKLSKDYKVVIGNWYGQDYLDILFRSKIFVVEGSTRDFLCQKYIEGAVCKAMLLGEIPSTGRDFLEDGVSIVEVSDYSKIDEQVVECLKDYSKVENIADECYNRVIGRFTLNDVTKDFINLLLRR